MTLHTASSSWYVATNLVSNLYAPIDHQHHFIIHRRGRSSYSIWKTPTENDQYNTNNCQQTILAHLQNKHSHNAAMFCGQYWRDSINSGSAVPVLTWLVIKQCCVCKCPGAFLMKLFLVQIIWTKMAVRMAHDQQCINSLRQSDAYMNR